MGEIEKPPIEKILEHIWAPISGYEGRYEVCACGQVRSWVKDGHGRRLDVPKLRKLTHLKCGYYQVSLGKRDNRYVHHLVAETFIGPRPEGMLVLHGNDIPTDNRVSNLRYGTKSENALDARRNGCYG